MTLPRLPDLFAETLGETPDSPPPKRWRSPYGQQPKASTRFPPQAPTTGLSQETILAKASQLDGIPPLEKPSNILMFCGHVRTRIKALHLRDTEQALDQVLGDIARQCRTAVQGSIDRHLLFATIYDLPNEYILERVAAGENVVIGLESGLGHFCEDVRHEITKKHGLRNSNGMIVPGVRRTAAGEKTIGQEQVDDAVAIVTARAFEPSNHYLSMMREEYEAKGKQVWIDHEQINAALLKSFAEQYAKHNWSATELTRLRRHLSKHAIITMNTIRTETEHVAAIQPTEVAAWRGQVPRQLQGGSKTKGG